MRFFLSMLLCVLTCTLSGQIKISGNVFDEKHNTVPFTTVRLLKDSILIQGAVTDSVGHFIFSNLKKDHYQIVGDYMGNAVSTMPFGLRNDTVINLILDTGIELGEVVVVGQKQLLERRIDRLVFNVNNSSAAVGMNAVDALQLTPLVKINGSDIGIIGKSGVKVMIDGKMLYLTGDELLQYLSSIQSDNILKIEVITAPPTNYDSEGNSGLINIVYKKRTNLGWSGSFSSGYTQARYGSVSNNITLSHVSENVYVSAKISQNYRKKRADEKYTISEGSKLQKSIDTRIDKLNGVSFDLDFEYQINKRSKLGTSYNVSTDDEKMNINSDYLYYSNQALDSLLITNSNHNQKATTHVASAYYHLKLDTLGKELSVIGNFYRHDPDKIIVFETVKEGDTEIQDVKIPSGLIYQIFTGQADLVLPYGSCKLETGAKYTHLNNESKINYYNLINDNDVEDLSRGNRFNYREKIIAGYINLNSQFSEKVAMQVGVRYEHSFIEGFTPGSGKKDLQKDYGKLFPAVYLSYDPTSNNSLSLNYSKRINRPGLSALNPFKWYSNPYSWGSGNPLLSPSYNHNVELGYTFKNNLSIVFYFQKEIGAYDQITRIQGNETYDTYENIYNNKCFGTNISYTLRLLKWWNTYAMVDYSYNRSDSKSLEFEGLRSSAFNYRIDNTISLDRKKKYQLFINYVQALPYKEGITALKNFANCSVGFKCSILEDGLILNLFANDIFRQAISKGQVFTAKNTQFYNNYYDARSIKFSLTYKFGHKKVEYRKKNIEFDERYRGS